MKGTERYQSKQANEHSPTAISPPKPPPVVDPPPEPSPVVYPHPSYGPNPPHPSYGPNPSQTTPAPAPAPAPALENGIKLEDLKYVYAKSLLL